MDRINGLDPRRIAAIQAEIAEDPERARRSPSVITKWRGGSRSEARMGEAVTVIGGDANLNPMQAVLGALGACLVDVVAVHATALGVPVDAIEVEASGEFDVRTYLGVDGGPGSGFDAISCVISVRAPAATPDQLADLERRCRSASPVADTLRRRVDTRVEFRSN